MKNNSLKKNIFFSLDKNNPTLKEIKWDRK